MKTSIKRALFSIPIISDIVKYFHFTSRIHKELKDCNSVLELGCGHVSYVSSMNPRPRITGIDLYEPSLVEAKNNHVIDEGFLMDVMDIGEKFSDKSYDCVIAMDLIEHLTKEQGLKLISMSSKIARKKVIFYTPNGFLKQGPEYGNPWQEHRSGWTAKEMGGLGFKVTGHGGFKWLRPQFAVTKKPVFFWKIISKLSHLVTRDNPSKAFQILCVKDCS